MNCIPGILSLAQKHRLAATLTSHYGEGAFELIPRSWLLPSRYWHWRLWAEAQVTLCHTLLNFFPSCIRKDRKSPTPGSLFASSKTGELSYLDWCLHQARHGILIPGLVSAILPAMFSVHHRRNLSYVDQGPRLQLCDPVAGKLLQCIMSCWLVTTCLVG